MRAVLIPPGERPRVVDWEGLEGMQALVGGSIEIVARQADATAYGNDDARGLKLPFNALATRLLRMLQKGDQVFLGPMVVCGPPTPDGDDTDVTPEVEKRILR